MRINQVSRRVKSYRFQILFIAVIVLFSALLMQVHAGEKTDPKAKTSKNCFKFEKNPTDSVEKYIISPVCSVEGYVVQVYTLDGEAREERVPQKRDDVVTVFRKENDVLVRVIYSQEGETFNEVKKFKK